MRHRLRILMDARMLLGRFSGVSRTVVSLSEELARNPDLELVWLLGNELTQEVIPRHVHGHYSNFGRADRSPLRRLWWEHTELPRIIRELKPDVYHATWNSGVPHPHSVPTVLTIHDLISCKSRGKGAGGKAAALAHRFAMRTALRRANIIVSVSNYTKSEIQRKLAMPRSSIRTIYNGVSPAFIGSEKRTTRMACRDDSFILYVGGHEPRKNIAGVLQAMQAYWENYDNRLFLYLTGDEAALCADAHGVFRTMADRSRVRFLGAPGDAELAAYYQDAALLLFLSTEEGFGLPAAEAMAQGCPVIAAHRGSLPELLSDAGILVDPGRPEEVAGAIHTLRTSGELRARCITRGRQRASAFCWARAAAAYRECYWEAYHNFRSITCTAVPFDKVCSAAV